MKNRQLTYFALIAIHIVLAIIIYAIPILSTIYGILIPLFGTIYILRTQNKNNEVLLVCSYVIASEVFLRMTQGNIVHEVAKYEVIYFMILGMIYKGFSNKSLIYIFFLLLLIPGIIYGSYELSFDVNVRKAILFNILGPICLGVSSIYCYRRLITSNTIYKILAFAGFPIVTIVSYLFLKTPNVKDVVTGTSSNFATSGGFGPNQVSTILGLGMIIFFALFFLYSKTKKEIIVHLILLVVTTFRAIVTFSRGGVYTGVMGILLLLLIVYFYSNKEAKSKIISLFFLICVGGTGVWLYSSYQTSGMIEYRYANQDAAGREKKDRLGGREEISKIELSMFWENPVTGIGVGKNKEYREELTGKVAASHNEITRMLAEQGVLGIICLLILLITPLFLYLDNKQHLLLLSFYFFWFLSINHAAMRTAAPAFIYALSLLKVKIIDEETPVVHREPVV